MKIQRPGNTEFHLIFMSFCQKYCNLTPYELKYVHIFKKCYMDWIYKTAGYYDKNVQVKEQYKYPDDYTNNLSIFIQKMIECLKGSDKIYTVGLDILINQKNPLIKYLPDFEKFYNIKLIPENCKANNFISYITNKKVLVVSPFKEEIQQQIQNKNIYKLHPSLENSEFILYKFPYTFFNNGPHNNIFETLDYINNDIKQNYTNFDIAILSCGCYGGFIVNMISEEMKKDAIYIGGELPLIFGIVGKRHKWAIKELFNNDTTYLINDIPEEHRPFGYNKIEDGCYW